MIHRYLFSYHLPPKGVLLLPEGGELSYYSVSCSFYTNTDKKRINTGKTDKSYIEFTLI